MLRFLRNIRQKLLENGNVRKYFWYALGEILLVVIGILLALQINIWNENRKLNKSSKETIENLYTEINVAISELEETLKVNERFLDMSHKFMEMPSYIDSLSANPGLIFLLTSYSTLILDLPVLQQELSSEKVIIDDKELVLKLREIKNEYERSSSTRELTTTLWNEHVIGYYMRNKILTEYQAFFSGKYFKTNTLIDNLSDPEFKNLVAMTTLINSQLTNSYEKLLLNLVEAKTHLERKDNVSLHPKHLLRIYIF